MIIRNYEPCFCEELCNCSGGIHSYRKFYSKVLKAVKPKKVLEWGPGANTRMAISFGAEVTTIEQNPKWNPKFVHKNLTVVNTPVESSEYVSLIFEKDWDLLFVDSRRRQEILQEASSIKEIVVCLHDAQRYRYRKAIEKFEYIRFIHRGFCVVTNSKERYGEIAAA